MRSRSSRLFVILLHLVGCPQHFHHTFEGIVGVQPWPIVLETFSPQLELDQERPEPVWLQDVATQTCLGPQGTFTADCGDATLWLPVRQKLVPSRRKRARMGVHSVDEEEEEEMDGNGEKRPDGSNSNPKEGLVFYLVDRDVDDILDLTTHYSADTTTTAHRRWWNRWNPIRLWKQQQKYRQALPLECLTYNKENGALSIQVCDRQQHKLSRTAALPQWGWRIPNEDSSLRPAATVTISTSSPRLAHHKPNRHEKRPLQEEQREMGELCAALWPTQDSSSRHGVQLSECQTVGGEPGSGILASEQKQQPQQVELTLVRYLTTPTREKATTTTTASLPQQQQQKKESKDGESTFSSSEDATTATLNSDLFNASEGEVGDESIQNKDESSSSASSLPIQKRDLAHMAALDWSMHPELPSRPRLLFEKRVPRPKATTKSTKPSSRVVQIKRHERLAALHNANPILLVGSGAGRNSDKSNPSMESAAESSSNPAPPSSSLHHRKRRIPVHPYIAASQNEVWKDPQTGLEYPTDLSSYLGYDRKEKGRHTIMGVGQYRKGYVIKVYGIAYYVSKRDVLADPFFEKYADMSADELRQYPEFFDHLRLHPHNFERSLYIKTNMQLSAEAIRGSLQADWSMLTDEAKDLILESSMRPLPMNERTLQIIQDTNTNPSKCSCESIAPEQYNANPSCCARGTELVFTWLKNGDFVCRLNGRVVDTFPRPDIAEGIFFEYLRNDDPISKEFHDNVVDGFPFLLAPLTQVQGFHQHASSKSSKKSEDESYDEVEDEAKVGAFQFLSRAMMQMGETMGSQAASMGDAAQRTMTNTANHLSQGTRAMWDSARSMSDGVAKDMVRRREVLMKRAASIPDAVMATMKRNPVHTIQDWMGRFMSPPALKVQIPEISQEGSSSRDAALSPTKSRRLLLSRWLGDVYYYAPDEIGPMIIHPTMNMTRKIFLFLVHLYLLLLFIVSFPGSYSTRTKFVYCRKTRKLRRMSSSSSIVVENLSPLSCYDDQDGEFDDDEEDEEVEDEEDDDEAEVETFTERKHPVFSSERSSVSCDSMTRTPTKVPFSPRFTRRGVLKYPIVANGGESGKSSKGRQRQPQRSSSSLSDGGRCNNKNSHCVGSDEEPVLSDENTSPSNHVVTSQRIKSGRVTSSTSTARRVASLGFGVRQLSPSLLGKHSRSNSK
ncbi:hypothetical protein ACA910_008768 [Epithemia clementina (nom. ined.)]